MLGIIGVAKLDNTAVLTVLTSAERCMIVTPAIIVRVDSVSPGKSFE